jgi:AraC-like DNA-binding protein
MRAPPDLSADRPRYHEYEPSPDLAQQVRCFWRITADEAPLTPNRICPDGCADIVLTGDGTVRAIGTMRTAAVVALSGRVDVLGVRFQPGAALAFFDVPLAELTDATAGVEELGWHAARNVGDQLSGIPAITGKIALIETMLRARQAGLDRRAAPRWLRAALQLLEGSDAGLQRVRDEVGASERTHERQFREMVGLSPKTFQRVARFRRALERMQRRSRAPYAAVAAEAGYADQAHLIREFKALAGITPAAYAREWDAVGFVQYRSPTPRVE